MALFFTLEKSCGNSAVFLQGCYFPSDGKVTKGSPGDAAIGRAASRPVLHVGFPPDPRYGGRIPGNCTATPARVVQLIDCASAPLPLAGQTGDGRAGWTRKARRLPPAVGAGVDLRAAEFPFCGMFLFVCPKRNQKCPGDWLRGAPALQSPAPGPPLRGTLPWEPYRNVGAGGTAD